MLPMAMVAYYGISSDPWTHSRREVGLVGIAWSPSQEPAIAITGTHFLAMRRAIPNDSQVMKRNNLQVHRARNHTLGRHGVAYCRNYLVRLQRPSLRFARVCPCVAQPRLTSTPKARLSMVRFPSVRKLGGPFDPIRP